MKRSLSTVMVVVLVLAFSGLVMAAADFGGQTVTIATIHPDGEWFASDPLRVAYIQQLEKDFNVKIEFKQALTWGGRMDEIMSSVIAGDPVGDVVHFYTTDIPSIAEALTPLDMLPDDYYGRYTGYHGDRNLYSYQGVPYALPVGGGYIWGEDLMSTQVIFYNKDFFAEHGLPDLYELQQAGEWTWAQFLEIAKKVTKDTDGDGEIDQWGFEGWSPYVLPQSFVFTNGGQFVHIDDDGLATFTGTDEAVLEALKFVHDLKYVERVVYPEEIGPWALNSPFYQGKAAMMLQEYQRLTWDTPDREFEQACVFLPRGPKADDHVVPDWAVELVGFPIGGDKDPVALAELVNAIYKTSKDYNEDYVGMVLDYFADRVDNEETLEVIADSFDRIKFWDSIPYGEFGQVLSDIVNGKVSPASAMEEIAPEVQAALDEIYNRGLQK